MAVGRIIVWLIVGAFAGTLAGRVVTLSKVGLGRWTNLAIGMLGAVVGGFLFGLLGINFGFADLKISVEDLISAFVGSLLCILVLWLVRRSWFKKKAAAAGK